jgi:hypothetical protein
MPLRGPYQTMKALRTIAISALAIWCMLFLYRFADTQHFLWEARSDRGIHLLGEPHICVWRAFAHAHGEHDGWTFFLLGDSPEGTRPVFYFPAWPLAAASAGVLVFAGLSICKRP